MEIEKYIKLIQGQSNLIDKLIKENEALREIIKEEKFRTELYVKSTIEFKEKYKNLKIKIRELV